MSNDEKGLLHRGAAHSSPYPVSRLAPAFDSAELAAEVALAESMLSARTGAKLRTDYSWTPADRADRPDDTGDLVTQLLRIGGLASRGEG